MASRVKKVPSSKEVTPVQGTSKEADEKPKTEGAAKKPAKKPSIKKAVLKAKVRTTKKKTFKINPRSLVRVLMENGKGLDIAKKVLIKNGAAKKPRKPRVPKIKKEPQDEMPPVLEPIIPPGENKQPVKKRKSKPKDPSTKVDLKKVKTEPMEEGEVSALADATSTIVKKKRVRKPKPTPPMEEAMSELTYLLEPDKIKEEPQESETPKIKKLTKKQLDLFKKDVNKKENINTLRKINAAEAKLIDRLDLNVLRVKKVLPQAKRRHSIEKVPIADEGSPMSLNVFPQLPSSPAVRKRRRNLNPYATRSDTPARLLRNGKHRNLKNVTLLEGLESPKRRKRVHSELSCSESVSKLSGYESDSSFSDLASLHGSEKDGDGGKPDSSILIGDPKSNSTMEPLIDTNSNLCTDSNQLERVDSPSLIANTPSVKVPEKGMLLDIMKQTFNDLVKEPTPKYFEPEKNHAATSTFDLPESDITKEVEELRQLLETSHDDGIPVIDNMLAQPPQNNEDLEPPLLESSVPLPLRPQQQTADLEKSVISMTEKDNVVSFMIEHITEEEVEEVQEPSLNEEEIKLIVSEEEDGKLQEDKIDEVLEDKIVEVEEEEAKPIEEISLVELEPEITKLVVIEEPTVAEEPVLEAVALEIEENSLQEVEVQSQEQELERPREPSPQPLPKEPTPEPQSPEEPQTIQETTHVRPVKEPSPEPQPLQVPSPDPQPLQELTPEPQPLREPTPEPQPLKEPSPESQPPEELTLEPQPLTEPEVQPPKEPSPEPQPRIQPTPEPQSAPMEVECNESASPVIVPIQTVQEPEVEEDKLMELASTSETPEEDKPIESASTSETPEEDKPIESASTSETPEEAKLIESAPTSETTEESPEELAQKESILGALGLQSLHAKEVPKKKGKVSKEVYTGTLKTVIKINKKKGKTPLKMTLQKKGKVEGETTTGEDGYKIMKESAVASGKHSKDSSDTAESSTDVTSDGEQPPDKSQPEKSLIVPEKASSFSIHPGRLCKDECSYCFGKFGLFDTPCHIAQMKSVDRQNKILASEKHLTRDSCLCDACYRHVDRKSNSPSYTNKSLKRNSLVAPGPRQNHCHVLGCSNVSTNILRRKWIIKMRKSICQVINLDLDNPGLHSIPICDEHYAALEHLMICAMCKRRLARNHIHYLGPEVKELNEALRDEGISVSLQDRPVVCKLCKCFVNIILKDPEERLENSVNFFVEYRKRLLHFNDIVPMDAAEAEQPLAAPAKSDKDDESRRQQRTRNSSNDTKDSQDEESKDGEEEGEGARSSSRVNSTESNPSNNSRRNSDEGDDYGGVDYNTLIPAIAMECPSDGETSKKEQKICKIESYGSAIEIAKAYGTSFERGSNDLAAQKLVQNPSISVRTNIGVTKLPGEDELNLQGLIDFKNVSARTPEGWEKSTSTIQYDTETKQLWQELQKPYGSKSSFLRHLVILEKYFRNGDLILSPQASSQAANYKESVQNRLRAYDNVPAGHVGKKIGNGLPPVTISPSKPETKQEKTPITLHQLKQPPLYPTSAILQNLAISKRPSVAAPPGLISINSQRPPAPATIVKAAAPEKFKFPITKDWRPTLIPIVPNKKKRPGLVQVVSGGKPYHITLEDYKKMYAIKRSFEMKQQKLQDEQKNQDQQKKALRPIAKKTILKTSGGTVTENSPVTLIPLESSETILDKLDKQVERLGKNEPMSLSAKVLEKNPSIQIIPRIPKNLTVIPQKKSSPPSPILCITPANQDS